MTKQLPPTPEGWILGTEAGYRHHAGFVKDAPRGNLWTLSPSDRGLWTLSLIRDNVAISTKELTFDDAVTYAG